MIFIISTKKLKIYIAIILIIILIAIIIRSITPIMPAAIQKSEITEMIDSIMNLRSQALLHQDNNILKSLYNHNKKYGVWAYEHELKKMKYFHIWSGKQGIRFTQVSPKIIIRYIEEKGDIITVNFLASTQYGYRYSNELNSENYFRIGTYHSIDLQLINEEWKIAREWYTDPFADSLELESLKSESIREFILTQAQRDLSNLNARRVKALEYADKFCGAASNGENDYKYNKKYINYNSLGGDCANFASQILHEGGGFKKNYTWNYETGGSRAWVNAQAFNSYMLYSGRASLIARGSYNDVYKLAYKLLPGDYIAYEKKGEVVHISVASGADSKGYTLVNSHNTDRYRVPWDLGWSNKGIKFWLVRVHY